MRFQAGALNRPVLFQNLNRHGLEFGRNVSKLDRDSFYLGEVKRALEEHVAGAVCSRPVDHDRALRKTVVAGPADDR